MSLDAATRIKNTLNAYADVLVTEPDDQPADTPGWATLIVAPAPKSRGVRAPLTAAVVVTALAVALATWRTMADHHAAPGTASTGAAASSAAAPGGPDYDCQAVSIKLTSANGATAALVPNQAVTRRVSLAAPARVAVRIRSGCEANATISEYPEPVGVDFQKLIVAPVSPNKWVLTHPRKYRLAVDVGMCDVGPPDSRNPQCRGGIATVANAIITVTKWTSRVSVAGPRIPRTDAS
jgi:hypothetical protein